MGCYKSSHILNASSGVDESDTHSKLFNDLGKLIFFPLSPFLSFT